MLHKIVPLLLLIISVSGSPELENDPTPPSIAELAAALMGGADDRKPCSFVTGETGTCVPFFNCIDVMTLKGDGACNLLSVCCKAEFIYEIPMDFGGDKPGSDESDPGLTAEETSPATSAAEDA